MKVCGIQKTKKNDAYLKSELIEMVFKEMEKGKHKNLTKTNVRKTDLKGLCKLLKIEVYEKNEKRKPSTKSRKSYEEDRVCTPRKVKEYPNAYTKGELVDLALKKLKLPLSSAKKMKIEQLCDKLDIKYIDVPVKKSKKKEEKKEEFIPSISSLGDSEDDSEDDEEEDDDCIKKSKLKLLNHQKKVVKFINKKKNRGLLVVHSVGSGKTLTAVTVSQCFLKKYPKSKVIVVTPTSLQKNFKKELGSYGVKNMDKYEFYTIQSFTIASKNGKVNCKNKLLILDEAHNIRTEIKKIKSKDELKQGGQNPLELLKCASKSSKVLLLTATPLINSPYDLLNLLAMIYGEESPLKKSSFNKLDKKGLIDYLKCKISVFAPNKKEYEKYYPRKEEEELFIKMKPEYYKKYLDVRDDIIESDDRINLFGGTEGLVYFYNGVRRATNNLEEKNSPKVNRIMKCIEENPNSKFLIYSNFIIAGNKLLANRLSDKKIPYLSIEGTMTKKQRDDVVKNYNSDKVRVLLISKAGGEGLDLKNTNFVFIMEPSWNVSNIEQVIGRAVRYKSHHSLPKEQRVVKIYKLYMIQPEEAEYIDEIIDKTMLESPSGDILSVDLYMRNLAITKQVKINKFLKKLDKVSIENIECDKPINYNDPKFEVFKDEDAKPKYKKQEDTDLMDGSESQSKKSKKEKKKKKSKKEEVEEDLLSESPKVMKKSKKEDLLSESPVEDDLLSVSPKEEVEEDILSVSPKVMKKSKKEEVEEDLLSVSPKEEDDLLSVSPKVMKKSKQEKVDEDLLSESPKVMKKSKQEKVEEDLLSESPKVMKKSKKEKKNKKSKKEVDLLSVSPKEKVEDEDLLSESPKEVVEEDELLSVSPKEDDDLEELLSESPKEVKEEEILSDSPKEKEYIEKAREYVKKKVEPEYKLGKFLGEGVTSIVFEGFDKKGVKVAIKYFKRKGDFATENMILSKLGELYKKFGDDIWIIKYCGKSLNNIIKSYDVNDIEDIFKKGLESIYRFHKKTGYAHSDIKPDNICVKDNNNYELMDYGNAKKLNDKIDNDASIYLKAKCMNKYKGQSFYDLLQKKVDLDCFQPSIYGNIVWSLRSSFDKFCSKMTTGDDIEGLILSIWNHFDKNYKLKKIYKENKTESQKRKVNKEILEFRLNPLNCPFPLLRKALVEIRKDYKITVPEMCKKLGINCKL